MTRAAARTATPPSALPPAWRPSRARFHENGWRSCCSSHCGSNTLGIALTQAYVTRPAEVRDTAEALRLLNLTVVRYCLDHAISPADAEAPHSGPAP